LDFKANKAGVVDCAVAEKGERIADIRVWVGGNCILVVVGAEVFAVVWVGRARGDPDGNILVVTCAIYDCVDI
jgi:hypothetical protein